MSTLDKIDLLKHDNTVDLCFRVSPINHESNLLHLKLLINQNLVFNAHVTEIQTIYHSILDNNTTHNINLEMSNKKDSSSCLNVCVFIYDFNMSRFLINTGHPVGYYQHNYNGNGPWVIEPFDYVMGCNGHVKIVIETPLAEWLMQKILYV